MRKDRKLFEKHGPIIAKVDIPLGGGNYTSALKNINMSTRELEDEIADQIDIDTLELFIDESPAGRDARLCMSSDAAPLTADQKFKAKEIFTSTYKKAIAATLKKSAKNESLMSLKAKLKEALDDEDVEVSDEDLDAEADSVLNATPLDTVIDALDDDVVDTLEDTSEDIDGVDPTTLENESAMRKINGLRIAEASKKDDKEKLNEESYRNIVKDWIEQGGDNDLDSFLDFAKDKGYDADNNPQDQNYKFKRTYRELTKGGAAKPSEGGASPDVKKSTLMAKEPHVNSAALNNLIDLVGEVDDHVATAAETVNEKFRLIKSKVRRVMTGKSLKNYYLLFGDAGIGKCVQYDTEVPVRLDDAIAEEYEAWLSSQK